MACQKFKTCFQQKFDNGMTNIGLCIKPGIQVGADEIKTELLAFQTAIDAGKFTEVSGVD